MVAKQHFPARLDDALAVFVTRGSFEQRGWRAILNQIADEKELGAKSSWLVGGWLFTHSGKEHAGRWTAKLAPTTKKKKAATQKTAPVKTETAAMKKTATDDDGDEEGRGREVTVPG